MARQVLIEVVDTAEGKRLRIREIRTRQEVVDAAAVERMLENLDGRIATQQDEVAQLQAERDDLAAKLAEL